MLGQRPPIAYGSLSIDEVNGEPVQRNSFSWISDVLALDVLKSLERGAQLCFLCKVIRMFSFGFLAVMLVIYLVSLQLTLDSIGLLFTLTLLGDAFLSILLTTRADYWGRRFTLIVGAIISVITSLIFATSSSYWVLVVAAILGVISPSGSEVGPFMAIELSSLSQVCADNIRTKVLAWYNLFGSCASACGALTCGLMMKMLQSRAHPLTLLESCRYVMFVYSALQVCQAITFYMLGPEIEVPLSSGPSTSPVGHFLGLHKSKYLVLKLCCLFLIDSFGGSLVLQSIISNWFHDTWNTSPDTLGMIVFICNIVAGVSALFAAKLADQIGLIMTMFVTHMPSNVLLILVPLMPSESLAIFMICARYSISQMDVPTRNAYVQGVVDADERSAANGVTNVIRSLGASTGPYLAGLLYSDPKYRNYPFYLAGVLKIVYDCLLLYNMLAVKPAHETVSNGKDVSERSKV